MKKSWIIAGTIGILIGLIIGFLIFGQSQVKNNYISNCLDKAEFCDALCKNNNLLSAGYGEATNNSADTKQISYDYTCNCLAQPMIYCKSDSDCVSSVGYCDIGKRVCLPIQK